MQTVFKLGYGLVVAIVSVLSQVAEDFGEIGMAPLFAAVAVGLALVLAAGSWSLGYRRPARE